MSIIACRDCGTLALKVTPEGPVCANCGLRIADEPPAHIAQHVKDNWHKHLKAMEKLKDE